MMKKARQYRLGDRGVLAGVLWDLPKCRLALGPVTSYLLATFGSPETVRSVGECLSVDIGRFGRSTAAVRGLRAGATLHRANDRLSVREPYQRHLAAHTV